MTRGSLYRRVLAAPLLHFVVLGSALFAFARGMAPPPEVLIRAERIAALERSFTQRTGRAPSTAERAGLTRMAIEDELWVREAFALGLVETDPVVQRRLVQIARFVDASLEDDASALEAARELGLDRNDPVVRRRLIERMRGSVRAAARARPVSAHELEAQFAGHTKRYLEPERFRITQVFLSRDRHGDALEALAAQELSSLNSQSVAPEEAIGRGDPFVHGQRLGPRSLAGLGARFGPEFARSLEALPIGQWSGPVPSAYGTHLVFVEERIPRTQPPLAEIEKRVREDLLHARARKAVEHAVEQLRSGYTVRIEEPR